LLYRNLYAILQAWDSPRVIQGNHARTEENAMSTYKMEVSRIIHDDGTRDVG